MAWIRDDPASGQAIVDLHGYSEDTALDVADRMVAEAFRQGYEWVRFIHGAAAMRSQLKALNRGEGVIKFALRQRLARQWRPYMRTKRSSAHQVADAFIVVAIRKNPDRELRTGLGSVPPADYEPDM